LTTSPLQLHFEPETAAELYRFALAHGINCFDTAEFYENYSSLGLALQSNPGMIIASRSYAVTWAEMQQSVERACRELQRDYVDIFGLHEVESEATLRGHRGALEYLQEAKHRGQIRAVSISTHTVAGVRAGA
jgi:aryl-alcohol dehydrogenase-like predicted oxidoreductase